MNTVPSISPRTATRSGAAALWLALGLALVIGALPVLCVVGVTGYFRLGSDAAALRQAVMTATPGTWHKKIALRLGGFTTGLLRQGSQLFNLPREARAALDAVHGGEVGIYRLQRDGGLPKRNGLLPRADKLMRARGWERLVGVIEHNQVVAIYLPREKMTSRRVQFCLFVFQEDDLIIASARGNLEPLLAIASEHLPQDYRRALHL